MTSSLVRVVRARFRQSVLLVVAAFIGWTSTTQLLACTPTGVHCPTAPTQNILVPVESCCGKVVAFVSRKPKPGEKGFVQCRCQEKRSAQQQSGMIQVSPHFEMMPLEAFRLVVPGRIPEPIVDVTLVARVTTRAAVPLIPPPSAA